MVHKPYRNSILIDPYSLHMDRGIITLNTNSTKCNPIHLYLCIPRIPNTKLNKYDPITNQTIVQMQGEITERPYALHVAPGGEIGNERVLRSH